MSFIRNLHVRYRAKRRAQATEKSLERELDVLRRQTILPPSDPALRARIDAFGSNMKEQFRKDEERSFDYLEGIRHPYVLNALRHEAETTKQGWMAVRAVNAMGRLGLPQAIPWMVDAKEKINAFERANNGPIPVPSSTPFPTRFDPLEALAVLNHPLAVRVLEACVRQNRATQQGSQQDLLLYLGINPNKASVDALGRLLFKTKKERHLTVDEANILSNLAGKAQGQLLSHTRKPIPWSDPIDASTRDKAAQLLITVFARHPYASLRTDALRALQLVPVSAFTPLAKDAYVRALRQALKNPQIFPKPNDVAKALLRVHQTQVDAHPALTKLDRVSAYLNLKGDAPQVIGKAVRTALLEPASRQPRPGTEKLFVNQLRASLPRLKTA